MPCTQEVRPKCCASAGRRDGLQYWQSRSRRPVSDPRPAPSQHPAQTPEEQGPCWSHHATISLDPVLSADEPTSPKKPKSVPEPESSDTEGEATSPLPSEWTSVRISPGEDAVGQDVLAVCVLVTSEDSRYAQAAAGWGPHQGWKRGNIWDLVSLLARRRSSLGLSFLISQMGTTIVPVSEGAVRVKH